jgi:predicted alpha/beta hydrolase family esterase
MPARTYLIVHGWQASGPGHWQTWLADRLRDSNESVLYPLLPNPDNPILDEWIEALHAQVSLMKGEKIVVCHSLGGVTWLHYATMPYAIPVDRLLLVALPCPEVMQRIPELRGFAPVPLDAEALSRSAGQCRLVCSSGDAYCDANAALTYAVPLGIEADIFPPEAGHINVASGYGPWPRVEKWCHDSGLRFSGADFPKR